jgi:hypothetical protein
MERRRLADVQGEDVGTGLVADLQDIGEALGDDQQGGFAAVGEQGIGAHRGTHLHGCDGAGGDGFAGFQAEDGTDAGDGRILVGARVLRQQLFLDQSPVGRPRDDVGEGAAPVDPEFPGHDLPDVALRAPSETP